MRICTWVKLNRFSRQYHILSRLAPYAILSSVSDPTHEKHHDHDPMHGKTVIGWSEYIEFPAWGIEGMRAKVDTGARTSAIHVEDIETLPNGWVRFHVMVGRRPPYHRVEVDAPVIKYARVLSSSGHYTMRYFVRTTVRIGPVEKEIEISLVSREKMMYRMLLGRRALARDFVVDVSRRRILGNGPKPKPAKAARRARKQKQKRGQEPR